MNTWGVSSSAVTVPELTEHIRHEAQPKMAFSQICEGPLEQALGLENGDTVNYTYYPNITTEGGRLSETDDVPVGSFVPVSGSYIVEEFGNATLTSKKFTDLAKLPVNDAMVRGLTDDCQKVQNTEAYTQANATGFIVNLSSSGNEFRTDATPASFSNTTNGLFTFANVTYITTEMEDRNIPYWDGESYLCVTGVRNAAKLAYDTTLTNYLKEDSGRAALNGEFGRVAQCRFLKDNHKVSTIVSNADPALILQSAFFFGADSILHDYASLPEIRAEDGDLGRKRKVGWLMTAGWKKIYAYNGIGAKEHVVKLAVKP